MAKKTGSKPMTKTEIMRAISETTGLPKKDVVAVVESLTEEIGNALRKRWNRCILDSWFGQD